jgi:hypothetical protein
VTMSKKKILLACEPWVSTADALLAWATAKD